MQQTPHPQPERIADTANHGARSTLIERLVVVLIIGLLVVGTALAVGRLDAAGNHTDDGSSRDVATDRAPDTTGAATLEGNTRP